MKAAFRRAAQLMARGGRLWDNSHIDGCCWAIYGATGAHDTTACEVFTEMFQPDADGLGLYWMGEPQDAWPKDESPYYAALRQRRVWALLLASVAWRDFA